MRFIRLLLTVIVGLYLLAAVLYVIPVVSGALDDRMAISFDPVDPSIIADARSSASS